MGKKKTTFIIRMAHQKNCNLASACLRLGPQEYHRRREKISSHLLKKENTLQETIGERRLEEFMAALDKEPSSNVRMRATGVGITSRRRGKIPLSDIKKDNHMDELLHELQYRHIVPYLIFGRKKDGGKGSIKRTHPIPKSETPETEQAHFGKLNWTALKDLLMADEERQWSMEFPCGDIKKDFDSKSFEVLCPENEFECSQ
jgi:hypothetical protein